MLQEMEENSLFNVIRFTDLSGMNHTSDGHTTDAKEKDYYIEGMKGKSHINKRNECPSLQAG